MSDENDTAEVETAPAAEAKPESAEARAFKAFIRDNAEWVIHELEMKRVGRTVEERAKNNP